MAVVAVPEVVRTGEEVRRNLTTEPSIRTIVRASVMFDTGQRWIGRCRAWKERKHHNGHPISIRFL
jgi:hypothetical protein